MRGPNYTKEFYEQEIKRLENLLTTSLTPEFRVSYQAQLASAREHLAELSRG